LIGFPPNKMLQVLIAISQKFCCREEAWVCKSIHKKIKKKKVLKKWTSVQNIENNGYLDARWTNTSTSKEGYDCGEIEPYKNDCLEKFAESNQSQN